MGFLLYRNAPSLTMAVVGLRTSNVVFARAKARKANITIMIENSTNRMPSQRAGVDGKKRSGKIL